MNIITKFLNCVYPPEPENPAMQMEQGEEGEITHILRCMNCGKNYPMTSEQYRNYNVVVIARAKQLGVKNPNNLDISDVIQEHSKCCRGPHYYWGVPIGEEKHIAYWKNGGKGLSQDELRG